MKNCACGWTLDPSSVLGVGGDPKTFAEQLGQTVLNAANIAVPALLNQTFYGSPAGAPVSNTASASQEILARNLAALTPDRLYQTDRVQLMSLTAAQRAMFTPAQLAAIDASVQGRPLDASKSEGLPGWVIPAALGGAAFLFLSGKRR